MWTILFSLNDQLSTQACTCRLKNAFLKWILPIYNSNNHILDKLAWLWYCHYTKLKCICCVRKWKKVKSLSRVRLFVTPWTVAYQDPLSMGFSRQEYWRGLPFPSPGDLPDPGVEPRSPALQADSLPSEPPGTERQRKRGRMCTNERMGKKIHLEGHLRMCQLTASGRRITCPYYLLNSDQQNQKLVKN